MLLSILSTRPLVTTLLVCVVVGAEELTSTKTITPSKPRSTVIKYPSTVSLTSTVFTNSTSPSPEPSSPCCFIVQDHAAAVWWEHWTTLTFYSIVNVTSYALYVTPMPSGAITSTSMTVFETNRTTSTSHTDGLNPVSQIINSMPGPAEVTNVLVNMTQVVTAGVTVASPAAFYLYSTLKVITAASITSNSQTMCAVPSSIPAEGTATSFEDVNTNVHDYWSPATFTIDVRPLTTEVFINTDTEFYTTLHEHNESLLHTGSVTKWSKALTTKSANTARTGDVTLSFPTPFVYLPKWGEKICAGEKGFECEQGGGAVRFGVVPKAVIDHVLQVPEIMSQYPGLTSCLPGYPQIVTQSEWSAVAPAAQPAFEDLTTSDVITVVPKESPSPAETALVQPPPALSTANTKPATSTQHAPTNSPLEPASNSVPPNLPSTSGAPSKLPNLVPGSPPIDLKTGSPPQNEPSKVPDKGAGSSPVISKSEALPQNLPPKVSNQGPGTLQVQSKTGLAPANTFIGTETGSPQNIPPAVGNPSLGLLQSTQAQGNSPENAAVNSPQSAASATGSPATPSSNGAIASAIASLIGIAPESLATTLTAAYSAILTIPYNVATSVEGSMIVISGSTNVIITRTTQIPTKTIAQGSTAMISGKLNVILSESATVITGLDLSGSTMTSGSTTYVVLSKPQTIAIPTSSSAATNLAIASHTNAASTQTSDLTPIQNFTSSIANNSNQRFTTATGSVIIPSGLPTITGGNSPTTATPTSGTAETGWEMGWLQAGSLLSLFSSWIMLF